jgi:uncharacterized protein (DUF1697 family)
MRTVVLLRGVNVGGNRKLPMSQLREWLMESGFDSVHTYIQSGNVIVESRAGVDVAAKVHTVLLDHTGWDILVTTRTRAQMKAIIDANPYRDAPTSEVHVSFLQEVPLESAVTASAPQRWLPEEFRIIGREIYLRLPNGMGRSTMAPRLALIKDATTRNWNTVVALASLADA